MSDATEQAVNTPEVTVEKHSPVLFKFTNKESSPYLDDLLARFYQGAYDNDLGIMEAYNLTTEDEDILLVAVVADENDKPVCFPLCRLLRPEEIPNYLSPNGEGGYFDPLNQLEAEDAREKMKTISQATVE